jgi:hypothetical protein
MRRMLSLLTAALVLSACRDAVAPSPDAVLARGRDPIEPIGIQSLTASISGPGSVGNWTTCTFTSSVSGGTAPYTYSWSIAGATGGYLGFNGSTSGSSVSATGHYYGGGSGTGSVYLIVTITDANGLNATPYKQVLIPSSSTSC